MYEVTHGCSLHVTYILPKRVIRLHGICTRRGNIKAGGTKGWDEA